MAQVIVLGLIALPLAGCGADGQGGPVISSLSTPTDAHSGEGAPSDSNPSATESPAVEDPTSTEDATASADEDFESAAIEEPADGEEDPTISVTSTPTGATARLTWDASPDPNVEGYFIHYGKQSSREPGSCSYEESQRVGTPPATITGLDPNTVYFFAISAFSESESESESLCSNEVLVTTPSVQG
jgi:hypothetical protein